jgi:hypothetical protein
MAVVRLSDAFTYPVYMSYAALNSPEKTALWESGIVASNDLMNSIARGPGKLTEMPFWNDLDATIEPDYTNDDPADFAVPSKITSGNQVARRSFLHKAWSDMDLVQELVGSDPLQQVRNRFGTYWARQWQRRLIATLKGVIADNVANDSGDMGIDISAVGDGKFTSAAFTTASFTMGDQTGGFNAIVVHSKIMAVMSASEEIIYVPDSEGRVVVPTYKGARVIMDDNMPFTGSGADKVYTSVLLGSGAFGFGGQNGQVLGYGEGIPQVAAYVERSELAGSGGGMETIGERKTWVLHPFGFSWIDAPGGGNDLVEFSPTIADLGVAQHWNRIVDRKQVPMAWIKSKGAA